MYSNQAASHFLYDFEHLSRSGKSVSGFRDYGSIQGAPRSHYICCFNNHSFLLSDQLHFLDISEKNGTGTIPWFLFISICKPAIGRAWGTADHVRSLDD